jgi:opacity protein-like surface antigen
VITHTTQTTGMRAAALAAILFAIATPSFAQQPAAAGTHLLGFVGGVSDGGGTTFGGGIQFPFGDRFAVAAEGGYLTGGQDFTGFGVDVDLHAISVDTNAHYQFPLSDNPRFTPYVLGGLGFLRASASVSTVGFSSSASDTTIGLNVGGSGVWHANTKFSLRPELRVFMADGSHIRFSAAFMYRFGG